MAAETDTGFSGSPWLFLLGATLFLGSGALVGYDLLNQNTVVRGLVANAASAAVIVALVGRATLANPASRIETRRQVLPAVVLFYGLYLLVTGALVAAVGVLFGPDPRLAGPYAGAGLLAVLVTFLGGGSGPLDRLTTLIGLTGAVLVVSSIGLFVYDLATGGDVLRGIAANGVGAALYIVWSAYDSPGDPESGVETAADALGIALLLYGLYLLVAGVTVVLTGVAHDRGVVGLLYLALGVVPLVLGFVLSPVDSLVAAGDRPPVDGEEGGDDPVLDEGSETDGTDDV